jgi:hypothetical protein
MEDNLEKNSMITFKDKPKLSGDGVDRKRDELRLSLVSHIERFLATDELFAGKEVSVAFSKEGISSLVALVETEGEKYVLKIPLTSTVTEGSEALFLKTWEAGDVAVPHVFKEGLMGDRPFVLMQFIDAPSVGEKYGNDAEKMERVYFETGRILRNMHKPEARGFGLAIEGRGEYGSFEEWLNSADMKKREGYVQEHGLLHEGHGSYARAKEILVDYVGEGDKSSYCHFDYGEKHLFATEPYTVFDPNPLFNHGYIDLGKTLVNYIANSGTFPRKLLEGYGDEEGVDEQALHAAIFANIVYKLPYQHQKKRAQVIENFHTYLTEHWPLLK